MKLHQRIMDKAYSRWDTSVGMTQQQFWNQLSFVEKVAVFTGNLNYQVENGGFCQWIDNRYNDCADELVKILVYTLATNTCFKIADMIKISIDRNKYDNYDCELCYYGCDCEEDECWCWCECGDAYYDDLDDKYYVLSDQFLKDVETWLQENVK